MSEELKYCKFCDKEKPIKEFCKSGGAIKNICRDCQNKKQKKQYRDAKILTELEEWLKEEIERINNFIQEEPYLSQINNIRKMSNDVRYSTLSKIQELKEKYK